MHAERAILAHFACTSEFLWPNYVHAQRNYKLGNCYSGRKTRHRLHHAGSRPQFRSVMAFLARIADSTMERSLLAVRSAVAASASHPSNFRRFLTLQAVVLQRSTSPAKPQKTCIPISTPQPPALFGDGLSSFIYSFRFDSYRTSFPEVWDGRLNLTRIGPGRFTGRVQQLCTLAEALKSSWKWYSSSWRAPRKLRSMREQPILPPNKNRNTPRSQKANLPTISSTRTAAPRDRAGMFS